MNCEEFDTRLNEILDRRALPQADRELAAHAGECGRCRQEMVGFALLADTAAWRLAPAAPAETARRVQARFNLRRRGRTWGWAALAASLLAAAWLGIRAGQPGARGSAAQGPVAADANRRVDPDVKTARTPGARQHDAPPRHGAPGLGMIARASTDRYLDLARQTSRTVTEAVDSLSLPADAAPQKAAADDWTRQVASGLKPLTDSTAGAFDFLLSALPEDRPAAGPDAAAPSDL